MCIIQYISIYINTILYIIGYHITLLFASTYICKKVVDSRWGPWYYKHKEGRFLYYRLIYPNGGKLGARGRILGNLPARDTEPRGQCLI